MVVASNFWSTMGVFCVVLWIDMALWYVRTSSA